MKKITISDYYKSLDRTTKKSFRLKVCELCEIESCRFYVRLAANKWSKLEFSAIASLIENNSDYEVTR